VPEARPGRHQNWPVSINHVFDRVPILKCNLRIHLSSILVYRSEDCEVNVKLQCVSRVHAKLNIDENGSASLENCSVNGTLLNGKVVLAAEGNVKLQHNDRLVVGNREFRFAKAPPFVPKALAAFAAANEDDPTCVIPLVARQSPRSSKPHHSVDVALAVNLQSKSHCFEDLEM